MTLPIAKFRFPIGLLAKLSYAHLTNRQWAIGNWQCWRGARVVELAALEML
jgi:hypothetical protein